MIMPRAMDAKWSEWRNKWKKSEMLGPNVAAKYSLFVTKRFGLKVIFGCALQAILFRNWFNPIVSFPLFLSLSVVKCDSHCHAICISRVKIDLLIGKR